MSRLLGHSVVLRPGCHGSRALRIQGLEVTGYLIALLQPEFTTFPAFLWLQITSLATHGQRQREILSQRSLLLSTIVPISSHLPAAGRAPAAACFSWLARSAWPASKHHKTLVKQPCRFHLKRLSHCTHHTKCANRLRTDPPMKALLMCHGLRPARTCLGMWQFRL